MKLLVNHGGFYMDIAANGEQAIEMTKKEDYHLIFMDLHMPKMNGFEAIEFITGNAYYKKTKIIALSAYDINKDKEIGKKALLYGAILGTIPDLDVLLNPFFSDIEQYSIHRAFSHSIFFAILFSLIFGYWFHKKFKTNFQNCYSFSIIFYTHF